MVKVEQVDREAYLSLNMLPEFDAADVRAGRWDSVTGLQAFARHRIEAEAAIVAWLRQSAKVQASVAIELANSGLDDGFYNADAHVRLVAIADAIERGEHREGK